jgi:hypothetical protein
MITTEELNRAKELCEKASPGPWECVSESNDNETIEGTSIHVSESVELHPWEDSHIADVKGTIDDWKFIAESRSLMPKLIARIEQFESPAIEKSLNYLSVYIELNKALRKEVQRLETVCKALQEGFEACNALRMEDVTYRLATERALLRRIGELHCTGTEITERVRQEAFSDIAHAAKEIEAEQSGSKYSIEPLLTHYVGANRT